MQDSNDNLFSHLRKTQGHFHYSKWINMYLYQNQMWKNIEMCCS